MKKLKKTTYQIRISRPEIGPGKIRLAYLTDLHNACSKEEEDRIFALLDEAEPDLVLCGGDMIIARPETPVKPAVHFMRRLAARYTVWCGTGNHEYRTRIYRERYGSMYRDYMIPLMKAGVLFLENESALVRVKGIPVCICGFDMDRRFYSRFFRDRMPVSEIRDVFGRPDRDELTILLAHNPAQIYAYLRWGADLTLCGHYHGGIVGLPGGRALMGPDFRLFPRNARGLITKGGRHVIVSAGTGEHTVPLRLNNPRELVIVDINAGTHASGQQINR